MFKRKKLDDLSTELARLSAESWNSYRDALSQGIARDEAALRARSIYDLAGRLQFSAAAVDADPILGPAIVVLTTLGDGFALLSANWPQAPPGGIVPLTDRIAALFVASGVGEWCRGRGYPIELGLFPAEAGQGHPRVTPTVAGGESPFGDRAKELHTLRSRQRAEWSEFESTSTAIAEKMGSWLFWYPKLLGDLSRDAQGTLSKIRASRLSFAEDIAFVKQVEPICEKLGAPAEALASLALISSIVRSLYLVGTASSPHDILEMSILPLDELEHFAEQFHLVPWIVSLQSNE